MSSAFDGPEGTPGRGALKHAEVFLSTSVYFGVDCRRCDHRIPLVEVISGPRVYQWFVPRLPPFEVRCTNCGTSRTYRSRHVIVFAAPTIEDFETHLAFERV